jgi:hypothetical protein
VLAALGLFGSVPAALLVVYELGGVSLFVGQFGAVIVLVAAFAAALALGERAWPLAFQREAVVAALLGAFAALAALDVGGYVLPLLTGDAILRGSLNAAMLAGVIVYGAAVVPVAVGSADEARRRWPAASCAGAAVFFAVLLATA